MVEIGNPLETDSPNKIALNANGIIGRKELLSFMD